MHDREVQSQLQQRRVGRKAKSEGLTERRPSHRRRGVILVVPVCVASAVFVSGCGTTDTINDAIGQIQNAQTAIQQESGAWRGELAQLQANLDQLVQKQQGQGTADARQILANTSNDVRSLTQDTIKLAGLTTEQLVARFGTEARCNADFARTRVSADLGTFVNRLKFWEKNHTLPPPPPHSVCQVTPDSTELRSTGLNGGWLMDQPKDKIVGVYGYDFRPEAVPSVELRDADGLTLRDAKVSVSYVTRYQINLNFATEVFRDMTPGDRYVLRWPDQPEPNEISVTLIKPAQLRIVGVQIEPPTARAKVDLVRPAVDVVNQGGSDTDRFTVLWTPGPSDPLQSQSVDNLVAGERRKITFRGYVYPTAGTFQNDIVVGDGSDSWHGSVVVAPYANTPHIQNESIQGQWPHGGGEPGDTKSDWSLPAVALEPGCEVDTSRGGGGFPLPPIAIAWPAGYDFNFDTGTFFASLSSVSVKYDGQANTATPVVTLKGLGGHGVFASRGPERFVGTFTVYSMCPG